jgi:hypothetical protein
MSRAVLVLHTDDLRAKAKSWIDKAPTDTRVTFQGPKRTLDQNSRLWAMLTDIAEQKEHCGNRYTPDQWKVLFMHACGREVQFIPSLDWATFIPWGQSSSSLSIAEMSELIEFMFSWGAQNGVAFHDQEA